MPKAKGRRLHIRLTDDQKRRYEAAAAEERRSLTEFVVLACDARLKLPLRARMLERATPPARP